MKATTPRTLLRQAIALDAAGREADAIPLYRNALAAGLSASDQHAALIGLGSSLRKTGDAKAAIRVLDRARKQFPRDPAVILFLARAHADAGQLQLALRQLGTLLLAESTNPRLAPYRPALARDYHALR